MALLDLKDIRKSFGQTEVLRGVDLRVADGELVVLVGPSGCGKSTLLRTIAGLESPTSGTIRIGERDVTSLPPKDRNIGMVFQSYALYPHLTVRRNLGFGLELRKVDKATIHTRTTEVAEMLGLTPLLERLPRQLSGGQRQRVAMGRAIVRRPGLFLFDEPLSNLDAALRAEVRVEIKRLHAELGATMVYVTHDQVEAMTLADRLVVLNSGRVEQVGPPMELYDRPASRFVGAFIGSPAMNFLNAEVSDGKLLLESGASLDTTARDGAVTVGIRPHDVHVADADSAVLSLEVGVVEAMGFESYVHGDVLGAKFIARVGGESTPKRRETLSLGVDRIHVFDPESGTRL